MDRIYSHLDFIHLYIKSFKRSKRLKNRPIRLQNCFFYVSFTCACFTPYDKSTFNTLDMTCIHHFTWFSLKTEWVFQTSMGEWGHRFSFLFHNCEFIGTKTQRSSYHQDSEKLCSSSLGLAQQFALFCHGDPQVFRSKSIGYLVLILFGFL